MKGDSAGSARLAAADERINRALADAVDRHATKDPGMRGTLKRASVVCHPGQNLRRKLHWTTPRPSVSYGGSSASGARPGITTSTDQNTDVTRTSSEHHSDVAMRGDGAHENSGGHPSSAPPDSRRRITTKREPREVREEQSSTTE